MLKPLWKKIFKEEWKLGLILILVFGAIRFFLVMNANVSGNYSYVGTIFLLMWLTPFVFLTRVGRSQTGMRMPRAYAWLFYAFVLGLSACAILYWIGDLLYSKGTENWFVYISRSYTIPSNGISNDDRFIYFAIYSAIGMTFSPIGEELFYRGLIHECFAIKLGPNRASHIDSLAFAVTHLAHFGIVHVGGAWQLLPLPALIWVIGMYLASRIFYFSKVRSNSILGAVVSHAGFNLAMMYFIFYRILS